MKSMNTAVPELFVRPEFVLEPQRAETAEIARPLSLAESLYRQG